MVNNGCDHPLFSANVNAYHIRESLLYSYSCTRVLFSLLRGLSLFFSFQVFETKKCFHFYTLLLER